LVFKILTKNEKTLQLPTMQQQAVQVYLALPLFIATPVPVLPQVLPGPTL
jgi:hypothetical protein